MYLFPSTSQFSIGISHEIKYIALKPEGLSEKLRLDLTGMDASARNCRQSLK